MSRRYLTNSLLVRPSLRDALRDPETNKTDRDDEDDTEHDDLWQYQLATLYQANSC